MRTVKLLIICLVVIISNYAKATIFQYNDLGQLVYTSQVTNKNEHSIYYQIDHSNNIISLSTQKKNDQDDKTVTLNIAAIQNYNDIYLQWSANKNNTDLSYDVYVSQDTTPTLYKSSLHQTSIHLSLPQYERPIYVKVIAHDRVGQVWSSETKKVTPLDTDQDGIPDHIEALRCTNANLSDTDGDGLTDGQEMGGISGQAISDPCSSDTDGDGLDDGLEYHLGTNPTSTDSDGDGMSDGWEYHHGLNPIKSDVPLIDFEDQSFGPYYWYSDGTPDWTIDGHANDGAFAARSGAITSNKSSVLETTVNSAGGYVSFDTATSSEKGNDELSLSINGREVLNLSGETPYGHYKFPVPAGKLTLRWEFHKDGSVDQGQDTVWLDDIRIPAVSDSDNDGVPDGWEYRYFDGLDADLSADSDGDGLTDRQELTLRTNPISNDTDNDGLSDSEEHKLGTNPTATDSDGDGMPDGWEYHHGRNPVKSDMPLIDFEDQGFGPYYWYSDGTSDWIIDGHANDGAFAARSGAITSNKSSVMETTVNSAGGYVSFDTATSSEEGDDELSFSVNGSVMLNLSGETPYEHYKFPVPDGKLTLRWEYHKDGSVDQGQDTVWLDDIRIPAVSDSDNDGVPDGWEYHYFDGLDADLSKDSDADGLTDLQEQGMCTAVDNADSDGDGLKDGQEMGVGSTDEKVFSNPCSNDSDGDGINDKYEVDHGTDALSADSTLDSNGDGLSNWQEYAHSAADNAAQQGIAVATGEWVLELSSKDAFAYTGITPSGKQSMTMMYWVRFTHVPGNRYSIDQITGVDDGHDHRFYLGITNNNDLIGGIGNTDSRQNSGINAGKWVHLAISYDASSHQFITYFNGIQNDSYSNSNFKGQSLHSIMLGALNGIKGTQNVQDAQLDDVQIWSRALDSSDIQQYMLTPPTAGESDLLAYYSFNHARGLWVKNEATGKFDIKLSESGLLHIKTKN